MIQWDSVLSTLGSSAIIVGALAWLSKGIITSYINRSLEKYKSDLTARSEIELERLRSALEVRAAKTTLEFTALHTKRAEIIADLYRKLFNVRALLIRLHFQYEYREIREDVDRKFDRKRREPRELKAGIDTLLPEEEKRVAELNEALSELYEFFSGHRLYFPSAVCKLIDDFINLASYQAVNYQNVAFKDEEGNLLVSPVVKDLWDAAAEKVPELLALVESEFRTVLGVESVLPSTATENQRENEIAE